MDGELLKSFLVGLGFEVNDASLTKFNKAIASATLRVSALYGSIKLTTAAVAYGITKISDSFEQLGYEYKIIAPAINKALILRQEMLRAYRSAGVNLVQVVQSAVRFNLSITKTRYAMEALYKSVASKFFPLLTKQSDIFRKKLYENMPKIQKSLEKIVKFIFQMFEVAADFGSRVWQVLSRFYELLVKLDQATDGWSTKVLALVAAWYALNLSFLATPLGMLLVGFAAILVLLDDFLIWKEKGDSLFDWSSFVPIIEAVKATLLGLWGVLVGIGETLGNVAAAFYLLFKGNFAGAFDALKASAQSFWNVIKGLGESVWNLAKAMGAIAMWAGDGILNLLGLPNVAENVGRAPNGIPAVAPLGANNSSLSNQNVSQQTQINIQGVADASAAGKAVVSEQSKVNFDMVRNLKGATTP